MDSNQNNHFNGPDTHSTSVESSMYANGNDRTVAERKALIMRSLDCRSLSDGVKISLTERIDSLIQFEEGRTGYKDSYDFTNIEDIRRYCLDRLEEIRVINQVFHIPSGFVCIAAFIGFLSRLAYGKNKKHGEDALSFKEFVKEFLPGYDADDMYSTLRCGIVHAMSFYPAFDNGRPSDKPTSPLAQPVYSITHSSTWTNLAPSTTNGIGLGIQAAALCKDIENAINDLFDNPANQTERDNAVKTLAWQPAITGNTMDTRTDSRLSD